MKGITIVSPMWGPLSTTNRMVFSVITQFKSTKNPYKIHLVLVDDYLEGRLENGESYYNYYLSDDFKKLYDENFVKISIIINKEHKYQGESREIGYMAGDYPYFILVDCDDTLAPNACDRYISIIRENNKNKELPISFIAGLLYGFDTGFAQLIPGESIWVQGRCYNRDFLIKHQIHFPTGLNSRQGEDYPFINMLDYAAEHDPGYHAISAITEENGQCLAYWFPNENSLSRKDPHYGQHLSGWTMKSSVAILKYFEEFNERNEIENEEDEFLKMKALNMSIYSFYNLLDFIKEVSSTDYTPLEEDWYALLDGVNFLRSHLKEKYWDEILYSSVEDELYNVRNYSDCRACESWIGTFYDFINNEQPILKMSYEEMIQYADTLEFDEIGHEIHSPQVIAWKKRHHI